MLKHQIVDKDKEMNILKLQLKNLKRSHSSDSSYDRNRGNTANGRDTSKTSEDSVGNSTPTVASSGESTDATKCGNKSDESGLERKQRSMSVDTSETLTRQYEIVNDELKLLRNKIARLEDDLLQVTQVIA